ncbi:MAG: diguanylate cyclase domain-containing protein [Limnohabitans sp.]|jgi:diguanylate cyclase (GGDEF)-like protein
MSAAAALEATHWRSVFDGCDAGLLVVDSAGLVQEANPAALALFRFDRADMQGVRIGHLIPHFSDDWAAHLAAADVCRDSGQDVPAVRALVHTSGAQRLPASLRLHALTPRADQARQYALWVSQVQPEATRSAERLAESSAASVSAHTQALQWLSRPELRERFLALREQPHEMHQHLALVLLNVDRFKPINDEHGHVVGDKVLQSVAGRIRSVARNGDFLARIGGDEFILIVHGLENIWEVEPVLSRLLHVTTSPILAGGHSAWIGFGIGVTIYPQDASTPEALIQHADEAMYKAKRAGGGGWAMWQVEGAAAEADTAPAIAAK